MPLPESLDLFGKSMSGNRDIINSVDIGEDWFDLEQLNTTYIISKTYNLGDSPSSILALSVSIFLSTGFAFLVLLLTMYCII